MGFDYTLERKLLFMRLVLHISKSMTHSSLGIFCSTILFSGEHYSGAKYGKFECAARNYLNSLIYSLA